MITPTGDLVGRTDELNRLAELLDGARQGRTGVLGIRGPAGIGKTMLLDAAVDSAKDLTVVRASGLESEATVSMSGLFDVARPLLPYLDHLPPVQAGVLRGALGMSSEPHPSGERFAVGMALLMLLSAAAEDRPLVVGVDDMQWVDAASRDALVFAGRRMDSDRAAILFTVREDLAGPEIEVFETLELGPLNRQDAERLLQRSAPGRLSQPVADTLLSVALGNPLALVELPYGLTPEQRIGAAALPEPMPITDRIHEAFNRRVSRLPDNTRMALLLAAASFDRRLAPVMLAARHVGLDPESLARAEADGLISREATRLAFRHPLVRSAVYATAAPADRRRAHEALAAAHEDDEDVEQHARHLAAAATEPSERVAELLEAAAIKAQRRGALAAAASNFEQASDLTADLDRRALRRLRAAQASLLAGDGFRAMTLLDTALGDAKDTIVLAKIHQQRAGLWITGGARLPDSEAFLQQEAALIAEVDPGLAVAIKSHAVVAALYMADRQAAVAAGEEAVKVAMRGRTRERLAASVALSIAQMCSGDREAADRLPGLTDRLGEQHESPIELLQLFGHVALARGFAEDNDGARATIEPVIQRARAHGQIGALPLPLFIASNATFLQGDWAAADSAAAEAVDLATLTGQLPVLSMALMVKTLVTAGRGREEECRQTAASAFALMDALGYHVGKVTTHWGVGLLELGVGRYGAAIRSLKEAGKLASGENLAPPGVVRWRADLIEALVATGQAAEARRHLAEFAREAELTGSPYAAAAVARCRGLVAAPDAFEAEFGMAQTLLEAVPNPFERARTELCWGRRLAEAGQREGAHVHLQNALAAFETVEAASWVERTREALEVAGVVSPPPMQSLSQLLTPRQLQVAVASVSGKTESEIAALLFITPTAVRRALSEARVALEVSNLDELRQRLEAAGVLDETLEAPRRVSISVLGGFDVRVGSASVAGLAGAPARALQAVAAHGGQMSADELAEVLWPEEPKGRSRLRNVLWRVSETAGALLVREGEVVRVADDVEVDVAAFETASQAALNARAGGAQAAVAPAMRAIAHYVGDLLAGQKTETWAVALRERLRRRYLTMLDLLTAAAIERGDPNEALRLLDRAIEAEPYDEARYLTAARLLLEAGRRAAALQFLSRGAAVAEELGVPVSPEYATAMADARET